MTDKTITNLTVAGAVDGTELLAIVQGGNSRKLTALALATAILGGTVLPGITWDGTNKALSISGSANTLKIAGSSAANPVAIVASGGDSTISILLTPKGIDGGIATGDLAGVAGVILFNAGAPLDFFVAHSANYAGYSCQTAGFDGANSVVFYPYIAGFGSRGTLASPTISQAGDIVHETGGNAYDGARFWNAVDIRIKATSVALNNVVGQVDFVIFSGAGVPATPFIFKASALTLASGTYHGWSSTADNQGATDTTMSRNAAGIVQFGTNGANASGSVMMTGLASTGASVNFTGLATADPNIVGRVWSNAGALTVSAG